MTLMMAGENGRRMTACLNTWRQGDSRGDSRGGGGDSSGGGGGCDGGGGGGGDDDCITGITSSSVSAESTQHTRTAHDVRPPLVPW